MSIPYRAPPPTTRQATAELDFSTSSSSPASPPPTIVVQPFHSTTPAPAPQLSTYTPSPPSQQHMFQLPSPSPIMRTPTSPSFPASPLSQHHPQQHFQQSPGSPMLPPYQQHPGAAGQQYRTAAEKEKDAYFSRSSDEGHWADPPPSSHGHGHGVTGTFRPNAPSALALLPPPKAAFASAPSSPRSPSVVERAVEFGDVSSIRKGGVGGGSVREVEVGRGGAEVRKSGLDWDRFEQMQKQEGNQSEWLKSKTNTSKKWFWMGWVGSVVVVVAIAAALAYHFTHKSSNTEPTVASLGGLNEKTATGAAASSTKLASSSSHSSTFGASSSTSSFSSLLLAEDTTTITTAAATTTTAAADEDEDEDEDEEATTTSRRSSSTTTTKAIATLTTTTTSARAVTTPTTSFVRTTTTTTAAAAKTTTTTSSAAAKTTSSASTTAVDERRLAKRFGAWDSLEWKKSHQAVGAHLRAAKAGEIEWRVTEQVRLEEMKE